MRRACGGFGRDGVRAYPSSPLCYIVRLPDGTIDHKEVLVEPGGLIAPSPAAAGGVVGIQAQSEGILVAGSCSLASNGPVLSWIFTAAITRTSAAAHSPSWWATEVVASSYRIEAAPSSRV